MRKLKVANVAKVCLHPQLTSEFESCHVNKFAVFYSKFAIFKKMIDMWKHYLHLGAFPTYRCLEGVSPVFKGILNTETL